jgi:hypothetical protein
MKPITKYFVFLSLVLALAACQTSQSRISNFNAEIGSKYKAENRTTHMSMGEKTVQGNTLETIKALLAGMGDLNANVTNIDKDIGFLTVSGRQLISTDVERRLLEPALEEWTKGTGIPYHYTPGNYEVSINFSVYEYDEANDTSKVKIRIGNKVDPLAGGAVHEMPPAVLREHYRLVWEVLGKYLFIETQT